MTKSMRRILRVALLACLAGASPSLACPPPPMNAIHSPMLEGEDEDSYFARLARNSLHGTHYIPAPRDADESDMAYQARSGRFAVKYQAAIKAHWEQARAERVAEAAALWDNAPQILLAVASTTKISNRSYQERTKFKVIERRAGGEKARSFQLTYTGATTSCGPYPPSFAAGQHYVFFARPGPLSADSVIAHFDSEGALEARTAEWLATVDAEAAAQKAAR